MKECNKCKLIKDRNLFYSDKSKDDGLRTICKQCTKEYQSSRECRDRANARKRQDYINNPERYKEYNARKYQKNKAALDLKSKEWIKNNPDKRKAISKKYYESNKETLAANKKEYRKLHRDRDRENMRIWCANNPDKRKASIKKYQSNNPHILAANCSKRRSIKLNATPSWSIDFFVKEAYALAKLRTEATGIVWEVDHIVPLNNPIVCGLHAHTNLQVIPAIENYKKGNRFWPDMPEPEKITQAA